MGVIAAGNSLFVIDIEYSVPLDQVQPHLAPHMEFVRACYADGTFLMSGPKAPRSGGVVIAQAGSRQEIEALMARDPFTLAGVMELKITEFLGNNLAEALK